MKRTAFASSLLALPFVASCTTHSPQLFVGSDDYEIAQRQGADGSRQTFRLVGGNKLQVTTEYERERSFLGFGLEEIDKQRAKQLALEPYRGLIVTKTYPGSAALEAGVRKGDIVLAVEDAGLSYVEQFEEAERGLRGDQEVSVRLLRDGSEIQRTLRTRLLREQVSDRELVTLQRGKGLPRPYAGVTLRGVPEEWSERIFGEQRNAVFLSSVEVGSPAWLAGFRGGDLIERVDGAPVPSVDDLSHLIATKGEAGQSTTWQVRREEGRSYEGRIDLSDYSGTGRFKIPLLFSVQDGTAEDKWRLGMGLIMGNRNSYVADTTTRRLKARNRFSALLGLIQVDAKPDETRVRLLWFITFET